MEDYFLEKKTEYFRIGKERKEDAFVKAGDSLLVIRREAFKKISIFVKNVLVITSRRLKSQFLRVILCVP